MRNSSVSHESCKEGSLPLGSLVSLWLCFLGSKITADGDCSHEIKRRLLLGRKTMTNLDGILSSRDITLLTKVHLVKAMVFFSSHVWMWELDHKESWALMLLNCGVGEASWESLGLQGDPTSLISKGNVIGRTDAEAETPILWPPDAKNWLIGKDPDAGKDWRWEEKGTTEDEMVGWHHRLSGHEFEQALGVGDREAWRAAGHGVAESWTQLSNGTLCFSLSKSSYHGCLITVRKAQLGSSYIWPRRPRVTSHPQLSKTDTSLLGIQGFPLPDSQPAFPAYPSFQPSAQPTSPWHGFTCGSLLPFRSALCCLCCLPRSVSRYWNLPHAGRFSNSYWHLSVWLCTSTEGTTLNLPWIWMTCVPFLW